MLGNKTVVKFIFFFRKSVQSTQIEKLSLKPSLKLDLMPIAVLNLQKSNKGKGQHLMKNNDPSRGDISPRCWPPWRPSRPRSLGWSPGSRPGWGSPPSSGGPGRSWAPASECCDPGPGGSGSDLKFEDCWRTPVVRRKSETIYFKTSQAAIENYSACIVQELNSILWHHQSWACRERGKGVIQLCVIRKMVGIRNSVHWCDVHFNKDNYCNAQYLGLAPDSFSPL